MKVFRQSIRCSFLIAVMGCSTALAEVLPLSIDRNGSSIAPPSIANDLVLPFYFDRHQTPMINLELEGAQVELSFDTGSGEGLHLTQDLLSQMEGVRFTGETVRSIDFSGHVNENARFVIDEFVVHGRVFNNIDGVEFAPWGLNLRENSGPPMSPVIGLGFFEGERILIDYSSQELIVFGSEYTAPTTDEGWVEIPFNLTDDGLVLDVQIAGEAHRMSLDSGATLSMVIAARISNQRDALPCETMFPDGLGPEDCRLISVETAFGGNIQSIYAFMLEEDPFEGHDFVHASSGLLGGDFLKKNAVQIDFVSKRLYVRPAS